MNIDIDKAMRIVLDDVAFGNAIEAAQEAHVAGLDDQEQLKVAIQAYLQSYAQSNAIVEVNYGE